MFFHAAQRRFEYEFNLKVFHMAFHNGCGFETAGWAETGTLSLLTERHVNDFRFVRVVETLRGVGPFFYMLMSTTSILKRLLRRLWTQFRYPRHYLKMRSLFFEEKKVEEKVNEKVEEKVEEKVNKNSHSSDSSDPSDEDGVEDTVKDKAEEKVEHKVEEEIKEKVNVKVKKNAHAHNSSDSSDEEKEGEKKGEEKVEEKVEEKETVKEKVE